MTARIHIVPTATALALCAGFGALLHAFPSAAQPTGATVVGGAATVTGAGTNSVIVNQSSDRAIINWNTFNIGTGGSATFNQPGTSSITLNRVTGGLGPSVIDGTLTANGRVFIINRDGMLFGRNATINTAGFLATTNDIRDADFMAGQMRFNIPGRPDASIVNLGRITATSQGFAALVAPGVRNSGTISARLGTVALASGNSFTLDMYGDRLIQLAVGDEIAGSVRDVQTGQTLKSLVTNEGTLKANGGRVEITAAAARKIVDSVINNKGVIEARSVGTRNGKIVLGGSTGGKGLPKQTVKVSGKLIASGKKPGRKGGTIQITGEDIVFANAMLDASGYAGGGKILVGGDYGGGRPIPGVVNNASATLESYAIPTATTVTVDAGTTFNASATDTGNGGKVILWSDVLTTFAGTIYARGGALSGDGGFVEVSGKQSLAFSGLVDTRAPNGKAGTLLLDPDDYTIDSSNVAALINNLENNGDVVIMTTAAGTGGNGDITVAVPVTWTSFSGLTLSAYRHININAPITNSGGYASVILRADNTGTGTGTVSFAGGATISTMGGVTIYYNPAGNDNATVNAASYTTPTDYSGNVVGGGTVTSYMLVNTVFDLQNIRNNLSAKYALGRDIDASATAGWNSGAGFVPIGKIVATNCGLSCVETSSTPFAGLLDGQGHTIENLKVGSNAGTAGLFGFLTGTVRNIGLVNVLVVGGDDGWKGGLAGVNFGTISQSYTTGAVTAGKNVDVGGLVGWNNGAISLAYSTASVSCITGGSGGCNAGGLVGVTVLSGNLNPTPRVINQTYATGAVSCDTNCNVGGLIGSRTSGGPDTGAGTVTSSYWDKGTTGQTSSVAGTGLTTTDARKQSSYVGFGFSVEGFWFMVDGQTRPFLRSEWSTTIRNTHQLQLMAMDPSASYTLGKNIDFTGQFGEAGMWGATGFAPVGHGSFFTGSLDGKGFTINALKIAPNNATTRSIGLFASIGAGGSVSNLNFTNASVNANPGFDSSVVSQWVGILAGESGGTITNVSVAGTVDGGSIVGVIAGGLVGEHGLLGPDSAAGTIVNSHAHVAVTVGDGAPCPGSCMFNLAGGLVGANVGGSTIINSFAQGAVTAGGSAFAGGLVGQNGFFFPAAPGFIANSYATGNVTVTGLRAAAGGLVGSNAPGSKITDSQAFGNVTSSANASDVNDFTSAGGLVGANHGTIESTTLPTLASACTAGAAFSCATGNVAVGTNGGSGGLVGENHGTVTKAFATGAVTGADGLDFSASTHLGGLSGTNYGTITSSFATGAVGGSSAKFVIVGGLVGDNGGTITGSKATGAVMAGDSSLAGGLVGNSAPCGGCGSGSATGASNDATIVSSSASGNVTVGNFGVAGGLVGAGTGTITGTFADNSFATGNVTGGPLAIVGGLIGANAGEIDRAYATGNVITDQGFAGGFAGLNVGSIALSYATGNVTSTGFAFVGGFVGLNAGEIDRAYAKNTVTAGDGSFAGGFVGMNLSFDLVFADGASGVRFGAITQSYAFSPVTGGDGATVGGFAGLNLGALDQVYGVGLVKGGAGSLLGGLVGVNDLAVILPDFGQTTNVTVPAGTATNSYWDMQTTGLITSAGGTGMNTAVLAGSLPPGFDASIWSHGSYPYLVNLGPQDTNPGPPVIPPVGSSSTPTFLPPPDPQLGGGPPGPPQNNTVVDPQQFAQQQQPPPQQPPPQGGKGPDPVTTGSIGLGPQPIQLDVGENRFFYLPPPLETRFVTNEVVIQLPCDAPQAEVNAILKQHNLTVIASQCLQEGGNAAYRLRHASSQTIAAVIKALAAHRVIAAAQANYVFTLTEARSRLAAETGKGDPSQYVPDKLRLAQVHRLAKGTNVPVAVIDSEVDAAHPDLTGAIAGRYNAGDDTEAPHAHGTGMAGAIVSGQRLLGVAPGAHIHAIRAFSSRANAESTTYNILKGIDWAAANKVRIVNMSFAGPNDPSLARALKSAHDKGTILIAAAGNAGPKSLPLFPAADRHVIAVTATDADDRLFAGANRGPHIAIAAPGVDILVPAPNGEYQVTTGTSVATAHVSGVVALLLERNPRLTPAEVRKILVSSARRLGPQDQFGAGLIDPIRALEMAAPRAAQAPAAR